MKKITYFASIALIGLALMVSCKKDNDPLFTPDSNRAVTPVVTVSYITDAIATLNGVLPAGYDPNDLIERGFEITTDPTFKTVDINNVFVFADKRDSNTNTKLDPNFTQALTGLAAETTYYVRGFTRTSGAGTTFSQPISFSTVLPVAVWNSGELRSISLANFSAIGFTMIDKDGDGRNWMHDAVVGGMVGWAGMVTSWSFIFPGSQADLDPENYLCFPAVTLPTTTSTVVATLIPNANLFSETSAAACAEGIKFVISENPLTLANIENAEVILVRRLATGTNNLTAFIPEKYLGKTVYIAVGHYDSKGLFGVYAVRFVVNTY
jgi:hypothetical protein